ncbi:MAG TPA: PQQ-binding-like beta-propeller repeat protein [Actinoplanes sp.]|nr:PQQ-binding-like beta-propeller repeat protein [Actinoplanes sp.]
MRLRQRSTFCVLAALLTSVAAPAAASSGAAATPAPPSGRTTAVTYQVGPSHDGHSGDSSLVTPLGQRWSRNLGGPVSYPLIAGGKVFVTSTRTPGGAYGTTLWALNGRTGATVWSRSIPGTYYWSAAAYDGGRVFVVNFDGVLRAFDGATGVLAWSVQLRGQHAFSSPPTAAGGTVYVGGAGSGGTLYAVRESDGAVLWTQPVANGDHSSPAVSGTAVFVSYACGLVYGFDRATGARLWFNDGPCEGAGGATPVLSGGRVYARDFQGNEIINAGTGRTIGTFRADPAPAFAGTTGLFLSGGVLRAANGSSTLWTFSGDGGLQTAPIVVGSTVYVGSSTGKVYGLSLAGGAVVWSTNVGSAVSAPDEFSVAEPLAGLGAGQGLLVVPAENRLVAYGS